MKAYVHNITYIGVIGEQYWQLMNPRVWKMSVENVFSSEVLTDAFERTFAWAISAFVLWIRLFYFDFRLCSYNEAGPSSTEAHSKGKEKDKSKGNGKHTMSSWW